MPGLTTGRAAGTRVRRGTASPGTCPSAATNPPGGKRPLSCRPVAEAKDVVLVPEVCVALHDVAEDRLVADRGPGAFIERHVDLDLAGWPDTDIFSHE